SSEGLRAASKRSPSPSATQSATAISTIGPPCRSGRERTRAATREGNDFTVWMLFSIRWPCSLPCGDHADPDPGWGRVSRLAHRDAFLCPWPRGVGRGQLLPPALAQRALD